jgi:hypothetical protein
VFAKVELASLLIRVLVSSAQKVVFVSKVNASLLIHVPA